MGPGASCSCSGIRHRRASRRPMEYTPPTKSYQGEYSSNICAVEHKKSQPRQCTSWSIPPLLDCRHLQSRSEEEQKVHVLLFTIQF